MLASSSIKTGRDPEVLRLVLCVNPVLTTAPVPEEQVPQRGTLRQIAGYLADAVQETAADARGGRRQRARHGLRQAGDPPVFWVAPLAWGVLGLFLLAWTVFEAVKHTGLTIPFGVIGLLVPFLSRLAPGSTAVHHTLLRVWTPLAVMAICSAIPGPADNTALPFTFGMAWLTHIALRRARGNGVRSS